MPETPDPDRNPDCPCTAHCPRHGDCDACRANHHGAGGKTACEKLKQADGPQ